MEALATFDYKSKKWATEAPVRFVFSEFRHWMEYFKSLNAVYPSGKKHAGSAWKEWHKTGKGTNSEQELKASDWMRVSANQ